MRFAVVVCLFLVIITGTLGIVSAQDVPSYKDKYVNDFANVLNVSQTEELRSLFSSVDTETSAEVVFVSLDTINGEDISQYAFTIGDSWKVGKLERQTRTTDLLFCMLGILKKSGFQQVMGLKESYLILKWEDCLMRTMFL